jgi:hypothetical protein
MPFYGIVKMGAALVLVSYRTGPILFEAIKAALASVDVDKIIIVDNGNEADAEHALDDIARNESAVMILRGQGNVGFAAGCNLGAHVAQASTLIFVNPDVLLHPDAPRALTAELATTPGLAIVGGDLRAPSGEPERGTRRNRITIWNAASTALGRDTINLHRHPLPTAPTRVGAVSGALLAIRYSDFLALGGFDEDYFLHMEDVDLCRRVEEAGGVVLFAPGPHGIHYRSSSKVPASVIARHKACSFVHYFRKFARSPLERAAAELAALALPLMTMARAGL